MSVIVDFMILVISCKFVAFSNTNDSQNCNFLFSVIFGMILINYINIEVSRSVLMSRFLTRRTYLEICLHWGGKTHCT